MVEHLHYSPNKVLHHPRILGALRAGEHVAPVFIVLLPTNRCNQACLECPYHLPGYSSNEAFETQDEIPREKLLEIVSDASAMGVKAIEVSGGGEPTLHPGFIELCDAILQRGIDLAIVTNGTRWNDECIRVALNAKWVRFSMEAATPETYASYRRSTPEMFWQVRRAVKKLCCVRTPASNLVVGVGFVVTAKNWREVLAAAQNAKDDGADNIRISAAFQLAMADYFQDFAEEASTLCKETKKLETDSFRVYNNFEARLEDIRQGHPDYETCFFQRVSVEIGADQGVYRCCDLLYSHRGLIGSLKSQRFSAMWFSEETKHALKDFDAHGCPHCLFNNRNHAISYVLSENPPHVNFV